MVNLQLRRHWRHMPLGLLLACAWPLPAQSVEAGGNIVRGVVKAPLGYGARGVTVWIHNRPTGEAKRPQPLSRRVTTNVRGEFSFSQIPAGNYVLCADLPHSDYLSTCVWENPAMFSVGTSKTAVGQTPTIQLRRGKLLQVSLPDPQGTRRWSSKRQIEEQIQFSVEAPTGLSLPVRLRHIAPYVLEYALLVPPEKVLRLSGKAKTSRFHSTLSGTSLDRKSFSQMVAVSRSPKPFVLTIPMEGVSLPKQMP